ncbi:hypothetical protein, partial [Duncaniella dubosii]|uniref:hypothetical protein n=2 Tax=Duncaniella TaxID=2518495 RepID=UPI0032B13C89
FESSHPDLRNAEMRFSNESHLFLIYHNEHVALAENIQGDAPPSPHITQAPSRCLLKMFPKKLHTK